VVATVAASTAFFSRDGLLLFNPGWFPKSDRKKQSPNSKSQNQNVSNAFHITNPKFSYLILIVYQAKEKNG